MAKTVRITKVERRTGTNARTIVSFRSGGEKFTFEIDGGVKEFREWVNERLQESAELVLALGLKQWLEHNRGSNDLDSISGTVVTLDVQAGTLSSVKE